MVDKDLNQATNNMRKVDRKETEKNIMSTSPATGRWNDDDNEIWGEEDESSSRYRKVIDSGEHVFHSLSLLWTRHRK